MTLTPTVRGSGKRSMRSEQRSARGFITDDCVPPANMLATDYARGSAKELNGIVGDIKTVILYTTHRWARLDPR